ncbi:hypothetical protein HELRODRAFT_188296 [Helobdella robusta]|uniref:Uncharacterized protein n=1 Tax=Helobdella robusta TaxID=6412 RepID=T1FPU4_HELRO|nr:hypothetical protein HELRODRAFT_188296 [Helobdella robusta]ESO06197.1 hypothetical protein HELRODRAFT_188296 [Helobdella robusta]
MAVRSELGSKWLRVVPSIVSGTRMDDVGVRVRLGLRSMIPSVVVQRPDGYTMVFWAQGRSLALDVTFLYTMAKGYIDFTSMEAGTDAINKLSIPVLKEPSGISAHDGRRPDGCTPIPWRAGRCLAWDVTVPHTLAERYVNLTSKECGLAAARAADEKMKKYGNALPSMELLPIYIERKHSSSSDLSVDSLEDKTNDSSDILPTCSLAAKLRGGSFRISKPKQPDETPPTPPSNSKEPRPLLPLFKNPLPVFGSFLRRDRRTNNEPTKVLSENHSPSKKKPEVKSGQTESALRSSWRHGIAHWLHLTRTSNLITNSNSVNNNSNKNNNNSNSRAAKHHQVRMHQVNSNNTAPMCITLISNHGRKSSLTITNNIITKTSPGFYGKLNEKSFERIPIVQKQSDHFRQQQQSLYQQPQMQHNSKLLSITHDLIEAAESLVSTTATTTTSTTTLFYNIPSTLSTINNTTSTTTTTTTPQNCRLNNNNDDNNNGNNNYSNSRECSMRRLELSRRATGWEECPKCMDANHSSDEVNNFCMLYSKIDTESNAGDDGQLHKSGFHVGLVNTMPPGQQHHFSRELAGIVERRNACKLMRMIEVKISNENRLFNLKPSIFSKIRIYEIAFRK